MELERWAYLPYCSFSAGLVDEDKLDTAYYTLTFDDIVYRDLNIILPNLITDVIFSERFNNDITKISWPESLRTLKLGSKFNQDISAISWSKCPRLNLIDLGNGFHQDISKISWPPALLYLNLGFSDITHIKPISSLKKLRLGNLFNHDITYVKWTLFQSLYSLNLGESFNRDISLVIFPQSMGIITFGQAFDQDLHKVNFHNIGIIHDYSNKITLDSCKFPESLKQITHHEFIKYMRVYKHIIYYERPM
jgi:hypothetical protein